MTTTTNHRTGGSRGANGYGEYQVRYASERQQLFIKTLLDTKEHSFSDVDVATLNVQGARELITKLLSLPNKVGVIVKASEKQLSYAQSLIQKKEGGLDTLNHYLLNRKVNSLEQLSRDDISAIITQLRVAQVKQLPITITEVGAYLVEGVIYSIRLGNQSKKWQVWSYNKQEGKYLREPIQEKEDSILQSVQPTDRLTLENAIKYSVQTGICCHCGRTLTVLKSVAGGIGPICAKRYN
jgi:hypothetical protein